jgi:hypothetical protein
MKATTGVTTRATTTAGLMVLAWAFVAGTVQAQVRGTPNDYKFDDDTAGKPPAGFAFAVAVAVARTKNRGKPGRWQVLVQPDAPSPGHVLGQLDGDDTSTRYPLAVTTGVFHSDVSVSVKCKALSGVTDQACGVVFRYVDENNHYLASASALEGNVRLHHVKKGQRTQLGTWDGKVPGKVWNLIAAEAKGDTLRVYFNGQKVIEARDHTLRAGGKAGMCTRADSRIHFDDFNVTSM